MHRYLVTRCIMMLPGIPESPSHLRSFVSRHHSLRKMVERRRCQHQLSINSGFGRLYGMLSSMSGVSAGHTMIFFMLWSAKARHGFNAYGVHLRKDRIMEHSYLHPSWHLLPIDQPGEQVSMTIALLETMLAQPLPERHVWLRVWLWGMMPVMMTSDN